MSLARSWRHLTRTSAGARRAMALLDARKGKRPRAVRATQTEQLKPGTRVLMAGTVAHERSGFVTVTWDNGTQTVVWRADLAVSSTHPKKELSND